MTKFFVNVVLFAVFVGAALSQTTPATRVAPKPTATPVRYPDYKTFKQAVAAAKATVNSYEKEDAWRKALALAKTADDKADAVLGLGVFLENNKKVVISHPKYGGPKTTLFDRLYEAYELYSGVYFDPNTTLPSAKRHEIWLRMLAVVSRSRPSSSWEGAYKKLKILKDDEKIASTLFQSQEEVLRKKKDAWVESEFSKLLNAPNISPDTKAKTNIAKAELMRAKGGLFGDNRAQFELLKMAAELQGASDEIKADALLLISDLALRVKDVNTYAGANERVTALPRSTVEQKVKAYDALVPLLIRNKKADAAQKYATSAAAVAGLNDDDRAKFRCYLAASELIKLDFLPYAGRKKAEANIRRFASEATEKTVAGLKGDDKIERYTANGKVFSDLLMFDAAREQYNKALSVKPGSDRQKAVAGYEIGETFRLEGKKEEARAAYLLVTNANPQYFGYSQQRIKELDKPGKQGQ
ncbi:MAG: hypothetical protein JFAIHJKO_00382 [Pyrinomonadaceae bacterium]|nr:hypothetical protein [Pyrinomonadaceae bacterium]